MSRQKIEIITTGGTFDKVYDPILGDWAFPDESQVPDILTGAGIDPHSVRHTPLMSIDSLDMTDRDRREIAKTVHRVDGHGVIITHGTDTMAETAQHLAALDALSDRSIMLTGAMIPYSLGKESDASFNLAYAYAMVQLVKRGVYIAMHGEVFPSGSVEKNRKIGRFVGRSLTLKDLIARQK